MLQLGPLFLKYSRFLYTAQQLKMVNIIVKLRNVIRWSYQTPRVTRVFYPTTECFKTQAVHFPVLPVCTSRHEKLGYANCDQFVPNVDRIYKTIQRVSVVNLKLFGQNKTDLWAKEKGRYSIMVYLKMGCWAFLSYQHGCRNTNVQRFSIF